MSGGASLAVDGWTIYAHPLFLDQLEALIEQVDALKQKNPAGFTKKNATNRLAAFAKLAFEVVPQDPTRAEYRQGLNAAQKETSWCESDRNDLLNSAVRFSFL